MTISQSDQSDQSNLIVVLFFFSAFASYAPSWKINKSRESEEIEKITDPTDLTDSPSVMAAALEPWTSQLGCRLRQTASEGALTLFVNLNARARFFLIHNSRSSACANAVLYFESRLIESEPVFEGLIGDVRLTFRARELYPNLDYSKSAWPHGCSRGTLVKESDRPAL
jgi:hypothetical protein